MCVYVYVYWSVWTYLGGLGSLVKFNSNSTQKTFLVRILYPTHFGFSFTTFPRRGRHVLKKEQNIFKRRKIIRNY